MDEQTKILIKLQADIGYIKEKIDTAIGDHEKLEKEVGNIKVTLIDHIAKIKGFGILLGIVGSIWTVLKIVQI